MSNHWYWKKRKKKSAEIDVTSMMTPPWGQPLTAPRGYGATGATLPFSMETNPAPEIKDMGLAIEPIVGVRTFDVSVEGSVGLHSINGQYWPPREPHIAYCKGTPLVGHEVPDLKCSCGIYAWNLEAAHRSGHAALWGEVYLWGDVLVYEDGFRAEMAYPKSLHISAIATRAAMRIRDGLEEEYGVPVTLQDPVVKQEPGSITASGGFAIPTHIYWSNTNPPFTSTGQ